MSALLVILCASCLNGSGQLTTAEFASAEACELARAILAPPAPQIDVAGHPGDVQRALAATQQAFNEARDLGTKLVTRCLAR